MGGLVFSDDKPPSTSFEDIDEAIKQVPQVMITSFEGTTPLSSSDAKIMSKLDNISKSSSSSSEEGGWQVQRRGNRRNKESTSAPKPTSSPSTPRQTSITSFNNTSMPPPANSPSTPRRTQKKKKTAPTIATRQRGIRDAFASEPEPRTTAQRAADLQVMQERAARALHVVTAQGEQ